MSLSLLLALVAAGPVGLELEWLVPEGECPSRAEVLGEVERLHGPDSSTRSSTRPLEVRIEVRASRPAGSWIAVLQSWSTSGRDQRELRAATCAELASAVAVIVAMALELVEATPAASPPRSSPPRSSPPRSSPLSSSPPRPSSSASEPLNAPAGEEPSVALASSPGSSGPLGISVRLEGLAELGRLPSLDPGLALVAALRLQTPIELRLELGGSFRWPQHHVVRVTPEAGGDFMLAGADARLCALPWAPGPWAFGLCAGLELGLLRAAGFGVTDPLEAWSLLPTVLADLWVSHDISASWRLVLRAGLTAPLARPMFTLAPLGELHQASAIGGRASLGMEFDLF